MYNGVLCKEGVSSECPTGTSKSVHVSDGLVIVFSGSAAFININAATPAPLDLYSCNGADSLTFSVWDLHQNPLPAGTTITVTTSNGTMVGTSTFEVLNTNITNNPAHPGNPANAATPANAVPPVGVGAGKYQPASAFEYTVTVKADGVYDAAAAPPTCTDSTPSGILTIDVTTPGGDFGAPFTTLYGVLVLN